MGAFARVLIPFEHRSHNRNFSEYQQTIQQRFLPQNREATGKRMVTGGSAVVLGWVASQKVSGDTLYAAKWNQLISFRKHLPVAVPARAAACEAITNTKGDAKGLSSRKYETPAGRNRELTSEVSITEQRNSIVPSPQSSSSPLVANISLSVTLSWRWPLSEMFQKVQLAAMKNDKFYFVATVTQAHSPCPLSLSLSAILRIPLFALSVPLSCFTPALASLYYCSFIIYQAYYESSSQAPSEGRGGRKAAEKGCSKKRAARTKRQPSTATATLLVLPSPSPSPPSVPRVCARARSRLQFAAWLDIEKLLLFMK